MLRRCALLLLAGCSGGFHPVGDGGADAGADAGGDTDGGPIVLADTRSRPEDLVVGSMYVYWVELGSLKGSFRDGKLMQVPIDGCRGAPMCPTVLEDNQHQPGGVALSPDGTTLYWVESADLVGTVNRIALGSGLLENLARNQDGPRKIAVDDQSVYWINGNSGEVRREWTDMGAANGLAIVTGQTAPVDIAVDPSGLVAWTNYGSVGSDGEAWIAEVTGKNPMKLAGSQAAARGIGFGPGAVFWTDFDAGTILRATLPDGAVDPVKSGLDGPNDVVVDGSRIFWVEGGRAPYFQDGRVRWAEFDGSGGGVLAEGRHFPHAVAVDGKWVYWVDRGNDMRDDYDGAVMKVAKPK